MRTLLKAICLACLSLGVIAAPAAAAPVWNLDIHHMPSNFTPGAGASATVNPTPPEPPPLGCTPMQGSGAADELQCLVVKALGGKFTLTFSGNTTPSIAYDATAAEVQAELEALASIGAGNVQVSGGPGDLTGSHPYAITFTGALSHTDVALLSAASASSNSALGGAPQYTFDVQNVGDTATSGTVTIVVNLPSGVRRASFWTNNEPTGNWSCPGSPGDTSLVCTTSSPIRGHETEADLTVAVNVDPGIKPGTPRFAFAQVSGGGAAVASPTASERTTFSPTPAPFGFLPDSFTPGFFQANGLTAITQSGAHPALFTTPFDLNAVDAPSEGKGRNAPDAKRASGALRNLGIDLPSGFVGDPTALPECATADFLSGSCPEATQVGKIETSLAPTFQPGFHYSFSRQIFPVFNLAHPKGAAADLGFQLLGNPIHIRAGLDPARNYAVRSLTPDINESFPPFNIKLILWGIPADPSHDNERCLGPVGEILLDQTCPAGVPRKPFITTPFECGTVKQMALRRYDSWEHTGTYGEPLAKDMAGAATSGCEQVPFEPTVSVAPTTNVADSPSGLDVTIESPQSEDPDQPATAPLRDATVRLPEGMTVNPASANGLEACTPAQISLGTDNPIGCPEAARIADVEVTTPVLPDPVGGTVFLATQNDNPFNSLLAAYLVLSEPERGILVKIPGKVEADPSTGQLTGIFKDNPQLPFSKFELHFKAGAHAALITPKTCGAYEAKSELAGWAGNPATEEGQSFAITQGPTGSCAGSEPEMPNSPSFDAGPTSPVSRNFSPFVLHLRRQDGTQRFGAFNVTLPEGLTGKLAGTSLCSDGALAQAEGKSGKDEQASPSCPQSSHVGVVQAAVGAGPDPYNAPGQAYLAGPYKGAPLSLAVITPAAAGPFDLGTIVIRTPLRIDSKTAQLTAISDPIPQMLDGIPTDVRSIDVFMDRPQFTLTGTSCDPASIGGALSSTLGQSVPISVRYQLSDCARLGFEPKISLRLKGKTTRGGHPALTVVLKPRAGDANIASLSLAMPRSEFLDQAHIKTICTRVQFAADQCPAAAVYGKATVATPLLDYALAGNVYLRSSDNLLPDLVPDLRGPAYQPIKVESAGKTDSIKGGIRNTFGFIPDAAFSKLVTKLPGGKKGLLVNSRDICAKPYRATVKYTAHNGDTYTDHPVLQVKCKGKARKGSAKHKATKKHKRAHGRAG